MIFAYMEDGMMKRMKQGRRQYRREERWKEEREECSS